MADNFAFTQGSGSIGAADDVAGVLYPRVKIALGADGVAADADTNAGATSAATLRVVHASDDPTIVTLGTDGASAPTITGTGVRGWLRAIYEKAVSGLVSIGTAAHSSAATGAPVRIAGRVVTAVDTTLVAGDVSDNFMTTGGAQLVKAFSVPETDFQANVTLTTVGPTALQAAPAAGIRNYVTAVQIVTTAATASIVQLRDGTTVIAQFPVGSPAPNVHNVVFPTPLRCTAATALNLAATVAVTSIVANVQGFQAP